LTATTERASQRGQLREASDHGSFALVVDMEDQFSLYQHNDNRKDSSNNGTSMIAILLA
jgi:hypothetical protein